MQALIVIFLILSTNLAINAVYFPKFGNKTCTVYNDTCVEKCPKGMYREFSDDCHPMPSLPTCEYPIRVIVGFFCGWWRCDCIRPTFLHVPSGKCYRYSQCPTAKNRALTKDQACGSDLKSKQTWQNSESYTGHCPMLKFRYGKCYGDNTRQILREIRSKGLFNKPLQYRPGDRYELANMPQRDAPSRDLYDGLRQREPIYMTGYTGYVPGMNFRYGKSYSRSADDCMAEFTDKQRELRRKADLTKSYVRSRSAPKMETIHSRDEIRRDLSRFREINKYKENIISPEFPPIAGYTGHIPRIKGSEASLSQRYHCAAKRGLELIRLERDKRTELQRADVNVREVLKDKEKKYSYWNWG